MREFRTSGSVRGEGGDILAYSASGTRDLVARDDAVVAAVSICKKNLPVILQKILRSVASSI